MSMVLFDPNSIIIPPNRLREANDEAVEALAVSLIRFGQLQPILINRSNTLVAGLHRVLACRINQMQVACIYRDEADELFLREVELEENIRRLDMTWQERERAIATLHEIRQKQDPNWGQRQTQELIGMHQRDISTAVQITRMIELYPEIASAKTKSQALNMAKAKALAVLRVEEVKDNKVDFTDIEAKIALGDSVEVIKLVPDESFRAIITDPPFGIDFDNRLKDGAVGNVSSYKDDKEYYEYLLSMAPDMYRVLKKDGWLIWFLGISWYERVKTVFREAGFTVDEIPIIWDRSEGTAVSWRADRWFGRAYDIALHCLKGDPQLNQRNRNNIIRVAPVQDRELLVERPVELYEELIRRLTIQGERVADPFTGSGSCLAAAASLGRDYWGCEKDPERRAYAIQKVRAHTPQAS